MELLFSAHRTLLGRAILSVCSDPGKVKVPLCLEKRLSKGSLSVSSGIPASAGCQITHYTKTGLESCGEALAV